MGEALQAGDQSVAVGEAIGADAIADAGRHDLLGAAAADAEEGLDGGAVDVGVGMAAQRLYNREAGYGTRRV